MQQFTNVYGQDRFEELLQSLKEDFNGEYDGSLYTYEDYNIRFNDLKNELPKIQASITYLEAHINYMNGGGDDNGMQGGQPDASLPDTDSDLDPDHDP